MVKEKILGIIKNILKKEGYKKKSNSFYKTYNDVIFVINLQKSQWGERFYINIGLWYKKIEAEMEFPKEYQCHLRFRIEDFQKIKHSINKILDPNNDIVDIDKFEIEFKNIIPGLDNYLKELSDKNKLLDIIQTKNTMSNRMDLKLRKWLGVNAGD